MSREKEVHVCLQRHKIADFWAGEVKIGPSLGGILFGTTKRDGYKQFGIIYLNIEVP